MNWKLNAAAGWTLATIYGAILATDAFLASPDAPLQWGAGAFVSVAFLSQAVQAWWPERRNPTGEMK